MKIALTNRGFPRAEFVDLYGARCSIQDSSLATDDAVWLGVDGPIERMHLSRDQVAALLPLLTNFVATGTIGAAT